LGRLSRQFAADLAASLAALQLAVACDDLGEAKRVLHTVKGTAGNLGARSLSALAGQLERDLQNQTGSPLNALLTPERLTAFERLAMSNTEQLVAMSSPQVEDHAHPRLTHEAFLQHLETIMPLLESHNLRGVTMVEALSDYQLPCSAQTWERVNQSLQTLDFKTASSLLQAMIEAGRGRR
jgi:HPt (histidine-containing phosphotransfer) domain-containing protein